MKSAKVRKPTAKEKRAYDSLVGGKVSFGVYHKSCFHLHTPVSYDYKLLGEWTPEQYSNATEQDLLEKCIKRQVIPPRNANGRADHWKSQFLIFTFSPQMEIISVRQSMVSISTALLARWNFPP